MKSTSVHCLTLICLFHVYGSVDATSSEDNSIETVLSMFGISKKMALGLPSIAGLVSLIIYLKKNETIYSPITSYVQTYVQIEGAKAVVRNSLATLKQSGSSVVGLFYTWPDRKKQKEEKKIQKMLEHTALQCHAAEMEKQLHGSKNEIDHLVEENNTLKQRVEYIITIELKNQFIQQKLDDLIEENKKLKKKVENLRPSEDELIKYKALWELIGSVEKRDALLVQAAIATIYKDQIDELKTEIKELRWGYEQRVNELIAYSQKVYKPVFNLHNSPFKNSLSLHNT